MYYSIITTLIITLICTPAPPQSLFTIAAPTTVCPSQCTCDYLPENVYTITCGSNAANGIALPNPANTILASTKAIIIKSSSLPVYPTNLCAYASTLTSFDLSSNGITLALPGNYLSCLTNLEFFYLYNNAITSIDANAFSNNLNLKFVDLSGNKLASIPSTLFPSTLTNLLTILLNDNELTSLDSWFFYLPSIVKIDLSNNAIIGFSNTLGFSLLNQNTISASYLTRVYTCILIFLAFSWCF